MVSTIRQHAGTVLVAAAVIFAAFAQGLFNPTGYAAASIIIWATVIPGLVGRALPSAPVGRLAAVAGICLGVIAVLATASVAWASDQGLAFNEAVRVSFYLGLFALAACTANRAGRGQWLAGLTIGLGVVTIVALFAYLQPGVLESGGSDVPGAAGRLAYPIGYWNGAGALLAAAAVLLLWAGVRAPTRELRTLAVAAVPLAILGMWLTSSRGSAAGLVIALAVVVAASPDRPRQVTVICVALVGAAILIGASELLHNLTNDVVDSAKRADGDRMSAIATVVALATAALAWWADGRSLRIRISRRVGVAIGAVGVAALVAGVVAVHPVKRFQEFEAAPPTREGLQVGGNDLSSNGRWQFWGEAVDAFANSPVGGVGAGGFEDWWARHATVTLFVRNPHSLPLQEAAELGVPGTLLFSGFLIALVIAARRRLRAGLRGDAGILVAMVVAGAVGAAVDWTWQIPAVFGPALICAALLLSSAPARPLARDGYWLGLSTVVAAWVAMVAGGLVLLTNLELTQSRNAAAANNINEGIDRARAAKTVQPWSAAPYTQLALLEEQRGDLTQALAYLRDAEQRDSEDWRLALIEARLLSKRGDGAAASVAFQRARDLSPLSVVGLFKANQG